MVLMRRVRRESRSWAVDCWRGFISFGVQGELWVGTV